MAEAPPATRFMSQASDEDVYAAKADRIAVYSPLGDVVAVIELVSPGNKNSKHAIRSFVEKTLDLLLRGVNLLVIDLFPPSRRDPQGIHKVIWDEVQEEDFELPSDKPLTMVAYSAGIPKKAYVEPVAVGDNSARHACLPRRRHLHPRPTRVDVSLDLGIVPRTTS